MAKQARKVDTQTASYNPAFVAKIKQAASQPLNDSMSGDGMMEHLRRLAQKNAA